MRRGILSKLAFAGVLFAALSPVSLAYADGNLATLATYNSGDARLTLDTYTDGPQVVALLGLKSGGTTISFAFSKNEWPAVLQLWQKAAAMSGSKYQTAGTLVEVGSTAQCAISLAGGPAVRITIVDPTEAAFVFEVQPGDQADFTAKLSQIGEATTN